MTEAVLKSALVKEFRTQLPKFVTIRHEDRFTHGIPDISITGDKMTSWLEIKYADPNFDSKGIQDLTMLRLAQAGSAWFVVYLRKEYKRTYIVHPRAIATPIDSWLFFTEGFNHNFIVDWIKESHSGYHDR